MKIESKILKLLFVSILFTTFTCNAQSTKSAWKISGDPNNPFDDNKYAFSEAIMTIEDKVLDGNLMLKVYPNEIKINMETLIQIYLDGEMFYSDSKGSFGNNKDLLNALSSGNNCYFKIIRKSDNIGIYKSITASYKISLQGCHSAISKIISSENKINSKKTLRYLFFSNGGVRAYFSDGSISACARCSFVEGVVEKLMEEEPFQTYIVKENGCLLIDGKSEECPEYNREYPFGWAMINYEWYIKPRKY